MTGTAGPEERGTPPLEHEAGDGPFEVVAVSPADRSSDRESADTNQTTNVAASDKSAGQLDELVTASQQAAQQAEEATTAQAEKLDRLVQASEDVALSNNRLALAMVEMQERAKLAQRRFMATVALLTVALVVIAGLLLEARNQRRQLADCIQPIGKCYQENAQRTAAAVGILTRQNAVASAAAAACVQEVKGYPAIQACVNARVAAAAAEEAPK